MLEIQSYNLNLDCSNLKAYEPSRKLYFQMLRFPQEIIPIADFVLRDVFQDMFPEVDLQDTVMTVRPFNTGRVVNMRELDPADIDQLVTVKGLLTRSSPVIPDMKTGWFSCGWFRYGIRVPNLVKNPSTNTHSLLPMHRLRLHCQGQH